MQDQSPDVITVMDKDGNVARINKSDAAEWSARGYNAPDAKPAKPAKSGEK